MIAFTQQLQKEAIEEWDKFEETHQIDFVGVNVTPKSILVNRTPVVKNTYVNNTSPQEKKLRKRKILVEAYLQTKTQNSGKKNISSLRTSICSQSHTKKLLQPQKKLQVQKKL